MPSERETDGAVVDDARALLLAEVKAKDAMMPKNCRSLVDPVDATISVNRQALEALLATPPASTPEATRLQAENARLREALKPFATLADAVEAGSRRILGVGLDGHMPSSALNVGGDGIRASCVITFGDLIAARDALAQEHQP